MEDISKELAGRLQREQVKTLYLQWRTLISGCAFVVLITAAVLWNFVDKRVMAAWVVANILFLVIRAHSLRAELKKEPDRPGSSEERFGDKAIFKYRFYSLMNSLLWGLVPLILFTDNLAIFSIAVFTHGGYVAAAVSATASYDLKSFYAFVYPATILWVIGIILNGGDTYYPHTILFSIYPLIMTVFAMRINNSFKEQILLQLENANLNESLREQRDRAENAMYEKNRFLAAASHDLRQPVHTLGLFVASLEPFLDKEKPRQLLEKIRQTTDNMGSLFHSLLDLSKLDADVVQNNPSHIYLKPLIDMLLAEYQDHAEQKQLTLKSECAADLVCFVDPSLLERILRNLLSNAVNHTSIGGVMLTAVQINAGHIMVSCIDTGKGIPADEKRKIFSEYHQLENPERDRKKGLGLGLAIVRRLCDLMKVEITLDSVAGEGSTFSLMLTSGQADSVRSLEKPVVKVEQVPCHAIVIDDEEDILIGMSSLLGKWGCRVTTAASGNEALSKLESIPDLELVIADFRLRENESGLGVIQRIRVLYGSDLPAILITGDTAPERLQQAALADVEVLHKPVDPDTLRRLVNTMSVQ